MQPYNHTTQQLYKIKQVLKLTTYHASWKGHSNVYNYNYTLHVKVL
jgi:hypothetical protein